MELLKNNKGLIILGIVLGVLIIVLLILNNMGSENNNGTNPNNNNNQKDIDYPEVKASPEEILSKVYNEDRDYYSGFTNSSGETENIFGNEKELMASKLDQKTKMSIALNNFNLEDLERVSCNNIAWNSNWNDTCGSYNNYAYTIPVIELNNKVEEIFNKRLDYSTMDLNNLVIGICTGKNTKNYKFRYIKEQSMYVSVKRDSSCINNGTLEVTDVEKNQSKGLLTLVVHYNKTSITHLGNSSTPGETKTYQDKFFYKVKEDGSYYFIGSTLYK